MGQGWPSTVSPSYEGKWFQGSCRRRREELCRVYYWCFKCSLACSDNDWTSEKVWRPLIKSFLFSNEMHFQAKFQAKQLEEKEEKMIQMLEDKQVIMICRKRNISKCLHRSIHSTIFQVLLFSKKFILLFRTDFSTTKYYINVFQPTLLSYKYT